jgi:hypothetical protein
VLHAPAHWGVIRRASQTKIYNLETDEFVGNPPFLKKELAGVISQYTVRGNNGFKKKIENLELYKIELNYGTPTRKLGPFHFYSSGAKFWNSPQRQVPRPTGHDPNTYPQMTLNQRVHQCVAHHRCQGGC